MAILAAPGGGGGGVCCIMFPAQEEQGSGTGAKYRVKLGSNEVGMGCDRNKGGRVESREWGWERCWGNIERGW